MDKKLYRRRNVVGYNQHNFHLCTFAASENIAKSLRWATYFWLILYSIVYIASLLEAAVNIAGEEMPADRLHPDTFKGCNSRFRKPKGHIVARDRQNKPRTAAQQQATLSRLRSRKHKSIARLAEMGIDYQLPQLEKNV